MGGRPDALHTGTGDDETELHEDDIENEQLDWELIGRRALAESRRVPAMEFMSVFRVCLSTTA